MFPMGHSSCHDVKKLRLFKSRVHAQSYGPSADIILPRETPDNIAFFPGLMRDPWGDR